MWVSVAVGGATALLGASAANKAASAQKDASQAQIDLSTRMYEDSVARAGGNLGAQQAIFDDMMRRQGATTQQTLEDQLRISGQTREDQLRTAGTYQTNALQSSQRALNAQLGYFDPFYQTGVAANNQMAIESGLAPGQSGYTSSPGYQWQLDEALGAVEGSASAAGGLMSGATMEAQMATAQGLASQDYYNYVSMLDSQANRGLTAGTNMAASQGAADATRQNIYGNTANMQNAAYGNYGANVYNAYGTQGANNYNTNAMYASGLSSAQQNTFNALAGAGSEYTANMNNAYANRGDATAAGYMAPFNALASGVQAGVGLYGYMNTPNPYAQSTSGTVPQSSQQAAWSGYGQY
jgi:hypothetical protein